MKIEGKVAIVTGGASGLGKATAEALIAAGADILTLDSAHGHSKNILECLKKVKAKFPGTPVIAGNIATAEGAKALIEWLTGDEASALIAKYGEEQYGENLFYLIEE